MTTTAPYRSDARPGRDGFAQLLHAEWTKFRTVRGWIIGVIIAIGLSAGLGLLTASASFSSCQQSTPGGPSGPSRGGASCMPSFALGPGGEPVSDSFYLVRQPLTGDGSITVRVTSMAGLVPPGLQPGGPAIGPILRPWAKAGIIIKQNLNQGSAYAAMMVTGDHGVRMQWNYTSDTAGLPGSVGVTNPRWLRLTRSGDVITGYDSADGTHWTRVGAVTLSGLPATVQAGLFAASPDAEGEGVPVGGAGMYDGATQVSAVLDLLTRTGGWPAGSWTGQYIGAADSMSGGVGGYHEAGGRFMVTGSGDIAPIPAGHGNPLDPALTVTDYLIGTFAGLIAIAVVAGMFITGEYRRKLIRTTLAASPRRGRVLAAKAIVIGAVSFVAGLIGSAAAVLIGGMITRDRGYYEFPVTWQTELRVIIGTGVLVGVAAVFFLAVGAIVRRSVATVAIAIVAIVVPYFLSAAGVGGNGHSALSLSMSDWLLRLTPAAGFALQQVYPAYAQVTAVYEPRSGYYPLAPWAGLAVLAAWTAVALAAAIYLLRRRDA